MGIQEDERNLNSKISRGGLSAAFLLQAMEAIQVRSLQLDEEWSCPRLTGQSAIALGLG